MTALPIPPGRGPKLYQATSAGPLGTSIAPSDVRPTDSIGASTFIDGIFRRIDNRGFIFPFSERRVVFLAGDAERKTSTRKSANPRTMIMLKLRLNCFFLSKV